MNINDLQFQELRRFAAVGRLSASMLHEISNPLTAAMMQLEISEHVSPAVKRAKSNLKTLQRYVDAARQQISSQSRNHTFVLQPQIDQLKLVLVPIAKQAGVKLEFGKAPAGCKLHGDSVKLQQIIANLVINAIQAYTEPGTEHPAPLVKTRFDIDDKYLSVQVNDWGKGIAPAELPKIFEPFYTTKHETGNGLGLGLAMVKQYTLEFEGSIKVSSTRRQGTIFSIKLPLLASLV
jgi:signal transduction histidine kinase